MVAWGVKKRETKSVVVAGCCDDHAAVAQVDLVEFGAVDADGVDGGLVGVDEDVIAGFQDFGWRVVERVGDGIRKGSGLWAAVRGGPSRGGRRRSYARSRGHWRRKSGPSQRLG